MFQSKKSCCIAAHSADARFAELPTHAVTLLCGSAIVLKISARSNAVLLLPTLILRSSIMAMTEEIHDMIK